jgi:hypothetical protein
MADIFSAASDLIGGVGSFVGSQAEAKGYKAAATAYDTAATYAQENAQIAARSTAIQESQTARQIFRVAGGQDAAYAANGLKMSGSADYVQAATLQQGGLQKGIIANQGQITEQGYLAESAADVGQAQQSSAQASASLAKGGSNLLTGILGAAASIFSFL